MYNTIKLFSIDMLESVYVNMYVIVKAFCLHKKSLAYTIMVAENDVSTKQFCPFHDLVDSISSEKCNLPEHLARGARFALF